MSRIRSASEASVPCMFAVVLWPDPMTSYFLDMQVSLAPTHVRWLVGHTFGFPISGLPKWKVKSEKWKMKSDKWKGEKVKSEKQKA